jgi:hypothetical protein
MTDYFLKTHGFKQIKKDTHSIDINGNTYVMKFYESWGQGDERRGWYFMTKGNYENFGSEQFTDNHNRFNAAIIDFNISKSMPWEGLLQTENEVALAIEIISLRRK